MKILTFGTCRILQLFDKKINNTLLNSIHYTNYGNFGGENIISFSHDIYQVIYILKLIIENKKFNINDNEYTLFKQLSVFNQNIGDYRQNYLSVFQDYDINESINNIHNQLKEIEYIILEVCTLKKLIINGVPLYLDINDQSQFTKITEEQFANDFDNLVNLVKDINPNIKIIFISHFIKYNNEIIPDRLHILNLLKENSKKYNNCYVMCPNDYIQNDDLEDDRYYKPESRYKILNALNDKILDIESSKIAKDMNETGIMQFNLSKYLNLSEIQAFSNINNKLDEMIINIKNNNINKVYNENKYMYTINSFLNEPYNLNNQIFIDFFNIVLHNLITKIAEKYLEDTPYIYNALMAVNYNCQDERCQSQNWHRDPGGRKLLKFFFFFDNINELNGTFEYIPNTQYTSTNKISNIFDFENQQSIYPLNYVNSKDYSNFIQLSNTYGIKTNCNKHDCIAVDTSGFHRAGLCSKDYYRKYLHILFLTKNNIINNKDHGDKYQNGFNHSEIYNVDINNIDKYFNKNVSSYFYK